MSWALGKNSFLQKKKGNISKSPQMCLRPNFLRYSNTAKLDQGDPHMHLRGISRSAEIKVKWLRNLLSSIIQLFAHSLSVVLLSSVSAVKWFDMMLDQQQLLYFRWVFFVWLVWVLFGLGGASLNYSSPFSEFTGFLSFLLPCFSFFMKTIQQF